VVYTHDDDTLGMVSARFSPLPGGEGMDVEGHHDPGFIRGKRQELVVGPTIQRSYLGG
jgi:hypothetical protein